MGRPVPFMGLSPFAQEFPHLFGNVMVPVSGSGFDADAQAYFDEVSLSDVAYTVPINQFVLDLKAASLWTKFDRLWVLANKDATAALTCLKSLQTATAVNSPTFTAGQGYAGNGTTSYINTGFDPSTHGVNYTLDSAMMTLYCRSATNPGVSQREMGRTGGGGGEAELLCRFDDGSAYGNANNGNGLFATAAVANSQGLYTISRTANNLQALYKAGSSIATSSTASTALPNGSPSALSPRQIGLAGLGGEFDGTETGNWNTSVNTLRTAIGF
jgi:hypothetical protein